jgi:hypothetical protein
MEFLPPKSPVIVSQHTPQNGSILKLTIDNAKAFRQLFAKHHLMFGQQFEVGNYTPSEKAAIHIDHLLHIGKIHEIYSFCDEFKPDELKKILNETPYHMYYGNVLHSTMYLYADKTGVELYRFFRIEGANPCKDYYGDMPWENMSCCFTGIPNMWFNRNCSEFIDTYKKVKEYESFY